MNKQFVLILLLLIVISLSFIGCSQPGQETIESTEAINPSPTNIQTITYTPQPTNTIKPTSTPEPKQTFTPSPPKEVKIKEVPLAGPIANPKAQISGMAWHGDTLIILPQYPEKGPAISTNPSLFILTKNEIIDFLNGSIPGPLTPTRISILGGSLLSQVPGYEGYEAIAITGDKVYLTIEANDSGRMAGYLVEGTYIPEQGTVHIDPASLIELPLPAQIFNYAYETLISTDSNLLTIYEANGIELNPTPFAIRADKSSSSFEEIGFRHIEYRMTDATDMDENGRFWVTNIFMPIEFWLYTESDPIFEKFGKGATHAETINVERLLELQYNGEEISLTETEPIQLELDKEINARNWEALVALDDMGFLAMTDTYPDTILAFIPFPEK